MRRALIAVFAAFAMIGLAFAQQSTPVAKQATVQPEFSMKQLRLPAQTQPPQASTEIVTPQGALRISPEIAKRMRVQVPPAFVLDTIPSNVCYTMNSFVFRRYNGGDATRLVKQTTCTPGSQFRVKRATVTTTR